jgi:hypothetical protein
MSDIVREMKIKCLEKLNQKFSGNPLQLNRRLIWEKNQETYEGQIILESLNLPFAFNYISSWLFEHLNLHSLNHCFKQSNTLVLMLEN